MSPRARHADRETTDPFGFPPVPDAAVPSPRRPDHSGGWVGRPAPAGHTGRAGPEDGSPPDERTWLEPEPSATGGNRAVRPGRRSAGDVRHRMHRAAAPDPDPDDGWDAPAPEVADRWSSTAERRRSAVAGDLFAPPGRWGDPDPRDAPDRRSDRVPRNAPGADDAAEGWRGRVPRNAMAPGEPGEEWAGRVPRNAMDPGEPGVEWAGRVPRNGLGPGDVPEPWGPRGRAAAPWEPADPWEPAAPWEPADPWDTDDPGDAPARRGSRGRPAAPGRADARTWTGEHEAAGAAPRRPARRSGAGRPPPEHGESAAALPPDEPGGALRLRAVLIPVVIGSLVAVALGVWARQHEGTGVAVNLAGFSSGSAVKAWLGSLALLLAIVQGVSGRMLHRGTADPMTAVVHRWSGRAAVLVTVPVAVQCLYAFGWSGATTSALLHSALGCLFYGAFVTKMLLLRRPGVPGWALAVAGGLLLVVLAGIWLTSALWFFTGNGLTL